MRHVVVHIAFTRMALAPNVFMRRYVLSFRKVFRARVERRIEIAHVDQHAMRGRIMGMASVRIGRRGGVSSRESAGEWVDPCTRT